MKNILVIACILCFSSVAHSQSSDETASCDCSVVRGQCRANIVRDNDLIVVRSDHQMCSRVTWFADEDPFTTIVFDGSALEVWNGSANDPFLSVADCEVCMSSEGAPVARPPEQSESSDNPQPLPIIQFACPRALDEVTGSATFSFSVTEAGEVANIELISTTQQLIVDKATSTLERWRYEPAIVDGVPVESSIEATVNCENLPPRRPE